MFVAKSNNAVSRIFNRQISSSRPGTSVHNARQFYVNLVPGHTIYDVECPDHSYFKFTDDGRYLISFSRDHQDVIVYRPKCVSFSCEVEHCMASHCLPLMPKGFDSFFYQTCRLTLASNGEEFICKDFFLYLEMYKFGLFATSTGQIHPTDGMPSMEKITFHLTSLEDGVVLDKKVFVDDLIQFVQNAGIYLYDDLLSILSLRYQTIHVLQVREPGQLIGLHAIGPFCNDDDELFLNTNAAVAGELRSSSGRVFLTGLKQRLLSFIMRRLQNMKEVTSQFYFMFQDYVDMIMWKVQFLDRRHLLIKFGNVEARVTDNYPSLFAVYDMETTEVVAVYRPSGDERLALLFEFFVDHFHSSSGDCLHYRFVPSWSNSARARQQLRRMKKGRPDVPAIHFTKKVMVSLPFCCQSRSPSPYLDHHLFRYDDKLISVERQRQSAEHTISFSSRNSQRSCSSLRFKLRAGVR